eukprot:TRINITY_DN1247_c0_g1_i1.p1 TRINITY_DN1247_c0_g1~~TRINITY_DN1247_c0_g1_i1.p1  ORF type:complete len:353 (-),score=53.33 TRINITY_DN1247_c0_g1_i1:77-1135(-)
MLHERQPFVDLSNNRAAGQRGARKAASKRPLSPGQVQPAAKIQVTEKYQLTLPNSAASLSRQASLTSQPSLQLSQEPQTPKPEPNLSHKDALAAPIADTLLQVERKTHPLGRFLDKLQPEIRQEHRIRLVEWLAEVQGYLDYSIACFFLAVGIVDRVLAREQVQVADLLLLGTAALHTAAKYEELHTPAVKDVLGYTDGAFGAKEVAWAERWALAAIDFQLLAPTPASFLTPLLLGSSARASNLATYICMTGMLDYTLCCEFLPSCIAAASCFVAYVALGEDAVELLERTPYRPADADFDRAVARLVRMILAAPDSRFEVLRHRYARKPFSRVAQLCQEPAAVAALSRLVSA